MALMFRKLSAGNSPNNWDQVLKSGFCQSSLTEAV